MTPWQSRVIGEAEAEQRNYRYDVGMAIAWHGEALARRKYLPSLKSLLKSAQKKAVDIGGGMERMRSFLQSLVKPKGASHE